MPDVSFSDEHQSIGVLELHVGTQKSESILILVIEKESKSLEKISSGKVCPVTHTLIDTCT